MLRWGTPTYAPLALHATNLVELATSCFPDRNMLRSLKPAISGCEASWILPKSKERLLKPAIDGNPRAAEVRPPGIKRTAKETVERFDALWDKEKTHLPFSGEVIAAIDNHIKRLAV